MTKEEIVERIKVCEKCESNYRKVNRLDRASAFSYEKIKWRRILSKLEKVDNYKQALIDIRDKIKDKGQIHQMAVLEQTIVEDFCLDGYECSDILQIIDKAIGDEK